MRERERKEKEEEERRERVERERREKEERDRREREHIRAVKKAMNVLHDKVKKAVHKYINNMTVADLEQMKNDNGGKAKDAVAYLVKGKLTYEQKQILDDDEIDRTIQTYVDENYDELKRLIEQIKKCFPSDATVVEEKRGEVTMLDLRVGDRILTTTPGGKLVYEDVFMFGKSLQ